MLPAPIDQRCEFASQEWLAIATAFLQREVPARPALADLRFSICEVFDHAPPHLHAPDNCISWCFHLDRGRVDVTIGTRTDVDLRVTGEYQHVLAMGQTVYSAGPEAVARAQRELLHRADERGMKITGVMPQHAGLRALFNDLHDHLAAHTVENPDLAHRLARLGLTAHAQQLTEQGYCIINNAVSTDFADELRSHVFKEVRDHHPFTTNGLMMRHRLFEEVALHPAVCAVAQSAVGRGMVLGAMSGTVKDAGPGAIDIHADYPLVSDPFPELALIAVACWALEDWTVEAGPTWVIPGSHKLQRAPKRGDSRDGAIPILMPKGSVALWSHGVWHWQGNRSLPGQRVAIHVTYNRVFVRQLDDFSRVDESFYARNPPAFSTLLGQDDPFGKSSYRGHDGKRFAYAGRLLTNGRS